MRIDGSVFFQLNDTTKKLNQTFQQLSSGNKINSAKDDPAGLALVNALAAASSGLTAANNNISTASNVLDTASGALDSTSENLQRLREIAVQASNGTLNDSDRANLQNEYDQVLQSIDQTASQTNFNGTNLLDGSFNQTVQTGPNAGQETNINIGSASTSALGVNVTGVSTQSSAQDALASIDSAISQVNSLRANIGASQSALEFTQNANSVQNENLQAAKSQVADTDFAEAQSDLAKLSIKQQAQISTLKAQLNSQKALSDKLFG
jgi:flagellin